jgi:SAM-dependent methyltransferase
LDALVAQVASPRRPFRVLEAGAGAKSNFAFPEPNDVTGIDVSEGQLAHNDRLARVIVGDIQTYAFAPEFDMVVCWNVLEHVPDPAAAIDHLLDALAPGGLLVIASPNLWSLKGIVTRFTPHTLHVWFHRYVMGRAHAGHAHVGPFRTYLRAAMTPRALRARVVARGLRPLRVDAFEGSQQNRITERYRGASSVFGALSRISRAVSRGRVDLTHSDYIAVFQRPE